MTRSQTRSQQFHGWHWAGALAAVRTPAAVWALATVCTLAAGCAVGPDYHRPEDECTHCLATRGPVARGGAE